VNGLHARIAARRWNKTKAPLKRRWQPVVADLFCGRATMECPSALPFREEVLVEVMACAADLAA
jgi:hypothetical protein